MNALSQEVKIILLISVCVCTCFQVYVSLKFKPYIVEILDEHETAADVLALGEF